MTPWGIKGKFDVDIGGEGMRATVLFVVLALAGCSLHREHSAYENSASDARRAFDLTPISGFPVGNDCKEASAASCQVRSRQRVVQQTASSTQASAPRMSPPATAAMAAAPEPESTSARDASEMTSAAIPAESQSIDSPDDATGRVLTDSAIKKLIIQASRESFYTAGHSCPCPYDLSRSGKSCGAQSAHSRSKDSPLRCYEADVSTDQVADYRAKLEKNIARN